MIRDSNILQLTSIEKLLSDAQTDLSLALNKLPLPINGAKEIRAALDKVQRASRITHAVRVVEEAHDR